MQIIFTSTLSVTNVIYQVFAKIIQIMVVLQMLYKKLLLFFRVI